MADPLYELLTPYFDQPAPSPTSDLTSSYLARLSTLSLSDVTTTERASLLQSAQSHLRNLQALSKRSHKAVIASSTNLTSLSSLLPSLGEQATELHNVVPSAENAANTFAEKYDRSSENAVLDRRKRAMLLSRNVDRVSDVLDLPTLLSSTISAAQSASNASSASSAATSYASALDLHAHIRRLSTLYPQSELIAGISKQAESEIQILTTILITSLQSPNLKLASAMRTVGWMRRVAPDLADPSHLAKTRNLSTKSLSLSNSSTAAGSDGALGTLFLICRLNTLNETLAALEPLRDLAEQERQQKPAQTTTGAQTERYLKRYIEIFREQSFNILSMYKSIFPSGLPAPESTNQDTTNTTDPTPQTDSSQPQDPLLPLPAPVASFSLHLVHLLTMTLRTHLPTIHSRSSRESLLTQVFYCASSLGRLGADFGMLTSLLFDDDDEDDESGDDDDDGDGEEEEEEQPEWAQVLLKHRVQASRLEVLARGVGSGRKGAAIGSPGGGGLGDGSAGARGVEVG
ncbi:hypothetical protein MBLNU230_g4118t1 [Neophaeotheca triangularis]